MQPVNELAELCGISAEYTDAAGNTVVIPPEYKLNALQALGIPIKTKNQIDKSIEQKIHQEWLNLLPNVAVLHKGQRFILHMHVPATRLNNIFKGDLLTENGNSEPLVIKADTLRELERMTVKNKEIVRIELELPGDLPVGYHQITLKNRALEDTCQLIVVPETCYEPADLVLNKKLWGSSIQLYTLRSENNWGIGDFSDLKELVTALAKQGANIIGLNPIHSLYSANPLHSSPYSPSSRQFINPLYIDITALPEYQECQKIAKLVSDPLFKQNLCTCRAAPHVDYGLVASLKYPILEAAFHHFKNTDVKNKTNRSKAFDKYRHTKGSSLELHATYEALFAYFREQDINNWGWPCWPEEYQHPDSSEVISFARKHKDKIRYFTYLQWQAETQLEEAQKASIDAGMSVGIYRDLAVGVDRGGSDIWCNRNHYALDASVGAPPDPVAPQGQNWGLPPLNPDVLKATAYAPFIEMVTANMQHCGALRIDHVMGLLRLWWCPPGQTADYGVYVNYPLQDLLGILKLESQRRKCLIFGEDLGTVPPQIEDAMPAARCYSNEVLLFSKQGDRYFSPEAFKSRALTCISNHDIPTLKAWWNCDDLDIRHKLGIYDQAKTEQEKNLRHEDKVAMLRTLHDVGESPWGMNPDDMSSMGYSRELWEKMHYYLAKTASKIVVIQLEDVMEVDTMVNIPGTSTEYPNWSRKLTQTVHDIVSAKVNQTFFNNISVIRKE